ncbi:hypothetical protein G9X64_32625 [Rhizobium sophorae]|uniref:NERD domain-containing protein n=4 Tax=Rhizobium TaxID=379 RepID=A0A246DRF5_9HYPH|nr:MULTISPECIES: YraN family protein [Rhizobium]ANL30112.1 hypothetical protein AMC90_PA00002 [Rhizobium phaseoli]MBB4388262.1 hypothetical protein [Rhizobium leguminosarum]MDR9774837.1 hypothetical protein [Rhizobium hidalgonense]NNU41142.1 hypothetical protein [Rhizobium sophorae]OWO92921.1 hypothetical protein B5E41_21060 [Rhizobium esperanzae]
MSESNNFRDFVLYLEAAWDNPGRTELPPPAVAFRDEEEQLNAMLAKVLLDDGSPFSVADLRKLIRYAALSNALTGRDGALLFVLEKIAQRFPVSQGLIKPSHERWHIALDVGRRLLALNNFRTPDSKTENMVAALQRLRDGGHSFSLDETGIDRNSDGFLTVTQQILARLTSVGRTKAFSFLEGLARRLYDYEFDQVLYSRNPKQHPRESSVPFGFLWQLTARVEGLTSIVADHNDVLHQAVALARDLVALTGIESYGQFWALSVSTRDIDQWLADATLHDHLFSLQQWTPFITPIFLRSFFGTDQDSRLRGQLGWGVEDAATASEALIREVATSPGVLTESALESVLPAETVSALLRDLTHQAPTPNNNYVSPFSAPEADLMFKPFCRAGSTADVFIPTRSAFGPACYEAVAAGLRKVLTKDEIGALTGEGLERTTGAILKFRDVHPTIEAKSYQMAGADGECDLVLEDDNTIIFIECKAKPITRTAMSGNAADAILLYLEGIVASQAQALQHQSMLESHGRIVFEDGFVLEHRARKIIRLSMTLFDYGTLQDRFVFAQLSAALTDSELVAKDPSAKKRVKKANETLEKLRKTLAIANNLNDDVSRQIWIRSLPTASLSIGQLAALLVEQNDVAKLARVLSRPASFATGSVLKEYHYLRMQQLV